MASLSCKTLVVAILVTCTLGQGGSRRIEEDVAGPIVKLADIQSKAASVPAAQTGSVSNSTTKPETIAQILDAALREEFTKETAEEEANKEGANFDATARQDEGQLETVVRIAGKTAGVHEHEPEQEAAAAGNSTAAGAADGGGGPGLAGGSAGNATAGGAEGSQDAAAAAAVVAAAHKAADAAAAAVGGGVESDVDRIIDSRDNEFVLSKPKESVASLTLDQQLIRDIAVVLVAATLCGSAFEAVRQPVINGYLIGGAIVGPGGLNIVKELVQVESLAQLGVQLLLFGLGLELSLTKLRAVWGVAVLGGSLQIALLAVVGGLVAAAAGAPVGQGVFVGGLLSMSSTAVVIKCLEVMRTSTSAYGQITVGTLILQDCMVGLMFALLPVFKGGPVLAPSGLADDVDAAEAKGRVVLMVLTVCFKLSLAVCAALALARSLLPPLLRFLQRQASRELVQLSLVAFCCGVACASHHLGLSSELGAFLAGVMVAVALGPGGGGAGHSSRRSSDGGGEVQLGVKEKEREREREGGAVVAGGADEGCGPELRAVTVKMAGGEREAEWEREREALLARDRERERERERERARPLGAHAAYQSIESARNVLVALFMASIGLIMSPRFLLDHLGVLAVGAALVVLVKGALVAAVVRGFSVGLRTSLAVGLSMAHVGEFAFVLLSHAVQAGVVPLQVYMLLIGVTALSLLTTPFIVLLAMHWVLPKEALGGGLGPGARERERLGSLERDKEPQARSGRL